MARIFEPDDDAIVVRDYFGKLASGPDRSFVAAAEALERKARIEKHPFFDRAKKNRNALVLWASQEAIVTNPFSQVLFGLMSRIKNVHVRSILLPVVHGEHSAVRNGIASRSHPWLIWQLCRSLGIPEDRILATKAICDFIEVLEASLDNPMRALGVLGIGNELMLLAEYGAVEACFDAVCPEADYREFLEANIGEDETHTKLIGNAAAALAEFGYSGAEFIEGARIGVDARVSYYDALLREVSPMSLAKDKT